MDLDQTDLFKNKCSTSHSVMSQFFDNLDINTKLNAVKGGFFYLYGTKLF